MTNFYTREEAKAATLDYFNGDELATNVWLSKYAMQDKDGNYLEKTPTDMHWRLANELARIEASYYTGDYRKNELSDYGKRRAELTKERIFDLLDGFARVIPQGSIMSVLGDPNTVASISNCVVIEKPFDSYGGILFTDQQLAQLYKRRAGVGVDISTLRPRETPVLNAAKSSTGAVSFMERFSGTTREVSQLGRRGAAIITLDIRHPDIEAFIDIKRDLTKVTGANISVMVTDSFMTAVKDDTDFTLQWPVDSDNPTITRTVKATELWAKLISAARDNAEPGIIFRDTMANYTTCNNYGPPFEFITTNPCLPAFAEVVGMDGNIRFGDLKIGDIIWAKGGWTTVLRKWSNGVKPVYKYTFRNGNTFTGTDEHKIVTRYGKAPVDTCYTDNIEAETYGGFDTIETKEYLGDFEVFNIEVSNATHTFWSGGVNVSNCSEIGMGNDSCRLLAVNLFHAVVKPYAKGVYLDTDLLYETFYEAQRLMDDVVDLEIESIYRILAKIEQDPEPDYIKAVERRTWLALLHSGEKGRRTGLGFTALGDTLAALGVRYDEGQPFVAEIMRTKFRAEWDASIDMAIERGAFPAFDRAIETTHGFWQELKDEFPEIYARNLQYGRRNISISTVAPTGSLSMLAKLTNRHNTSGGVEPVFALSYTRRKKVNPSDKDVQIDFVDATGDAWQHFEVFHAGLQEWATVNGVKDLKAAVVDSPYYQATANEIDWIERVRLQGLIQRYTTHSISSTLNLPNDVTDAEVSEIYMALYEHGCKGGTIYRDGCRTGVMIKDTPTEVTTINKNDAPKRPAELPAIVANTSVQGNNWVVVIGLLGDNPYEIFAFPHSRINCTDGVVTKLGGGSYTLTCNDKMIIENIPADMTTDEQRALTRLISLALRHGADVKYIVEQLGKAGGTVADFTAAINRIIKRTLPDGTEIKAKCGDCGSTTVVLQEGCLSCYQCGSSKCG